MGHAHEMHALLDVLRTAFWVTGFVFVMMLVIEYINVLTAGAWQRGLAGRRRGQYLLVVAAGALFIVATVPDSVVHRAASNAWMGDLS
jgi:hypothetical protein